MSSKELTKKQSQPSEIVDYKVFSMDGARLQEVLQTNLGGQGLSPFEMDRVKIPSGGGTAWQVPTLQGTKNVDALEGIILHFRDMRSYWPSSFTGGNTPPECTSLDGDIGIGDPGGECHKCPFALFGSADKGGGQACKQIRMLFILRPDDLIPLVLPLPPTSHKNCKQYLYRLASKVVQYQEVVTQFTLTTTKNPDGIEYSKCEFQMVRLLADEEIAKIKTAAMAMKGAFGAQTIEATDVTDVTDVTKAGQDDANAKRK